MAACAREGSGRVGQAWPLWLPARERVQAVNQTIGNVCDALKVLAKTNKSTHCLHPFDWPAHLGFAIGEFGQRGLKSDSVAFRGD